MSVTWGEGPPAVGEFIELRRLAGLDRRSPSAAAKGLEGGLHTVTARERGRLVGIGRLVGDGGMMAAISDIAVDPGFRGQGIGTGILERLLTWAEAELPASCDVCVIAQPGTFALYRRQGFEMRTGMVRTLT